MNLTDLRSESLRNKLKTRTGKYTQNQPLPGTPVMHQMSVGPDLSHLHGQTSTHSPGYAICAYEGQAYKLLLFVHS